MLVTSCLDNICRVWAETLPPEEGWGPGGGRLTNQTGRNRAHRHKHRFMQRLKHMKYVLYFSFSINISTCMKIKLLNFICFLRTCFHIRRTAQTSKQHLGPPIPTLPSTYSVHDFHNSYQSNYPSAGLYTTK